MQTARRALPDEGDRMKNDYRVRGRSRGRELVRAASGPTSLNRVGRMEHIDEKIKKILKQKIKSVSN